MARVIRAGGARIVPVALRDAAEKAERLLREAEERAARLEEERLAELSARAEERAQAELLASLLEAEEARRAAFAEAEASIVPLALAIARRLLGEELTLRPEAIRAIVREAIGRARDSSRIQVRVHPEDAAHLDERAVEVVRDPAIERGGCVVETERGVVDARLETRLEALGRALEDTLPSAKET